jgi:hypothetical protein
MWLDTTQNVTLGEHDIIFSIGTPQKPSGNGGKVMLEVNGKDKIEYRVKIVLDELSLGIQWDRPSLIVLVYRSEHIKNIVQAILAKSLVESGQIVLQYLVDNLHYDIPLDLLDHPKHRNAVFFVSGLRWGGGRGYSNAYRALNSIENILLMGILEPYSGLQ